MANSVTGFLTGGLFGNTPDYGGAALTNEKNRKLAINQGMATLNAVFGGGTVPSYQQAQGSYDKKQNYFINQGGAFHPWHLGDTQSHSMPEGLWNVASATTGNPLLQLINPFGSDPEPPDYKGIYGKTVSSGAAGNNIYTRGPDTTYQGFNPQFYQNRVYDYVNYALPQLGAQQKQTSDSINYGLANRGILNSSAAKKAQSQLGVQTGLAEQNIADTAQNQAQDLKNKVEAARSASINQLYQTGDPSQSTAQAISTAAGFQVPQAFGPLSNMFSNLAQQYASNQLYNQYNPTPNYQNSMYGQNNPNAGALGKVSY